MRNERFHKKSLIFFTSRAELQLMPDAPGRVLPWVWRRHR